MNKPMTEDAEILRLREASVWVQRLHEAPDDEQTLSSWLEWCGRSPEHLDAFEQTQRVWLGFGAGSPKKPSRVLAAKAAARTRRPFRRRNRRSALSIAAGVAVAMAVGTGLFVRFSPDAVYSAAVGEQRSELLADGSRLDLGGGSKVAVRYTAGRREIQLERGEAFFTVAHNPQRPFVVMAGSVHVIAVGTAFDVRRGIDDTVVTVSQGRVRITSANELSLLTMDAPQPQPVQADAGQRVVYSAPTHHVQVASIDPRSADGWRNGVFDFVAEPLAEVVHDVNRYSNRKIVVADDALGRRLFTGTIHQNGVDEWLEALVKIFPLTVIDRGDQGIVLEARPGAPIGRPASAPKS